MLLLIAIAAALTNVLGRMVEDERQGWAIFAAMGILLLVGLTTTYWSESRAKRQAEFSATCQVFLPPRFSDAILTVIMAPQNPGSTIASRHITWAVQWFTSPCNPAVRPNIATGGEIGTGLQA